MNWQGDERRADLPNRHEFNGLQSWIKDIDEKMILHSTQEVRMEQRLDSLERDVSEIKNDVKSLLEIWTEAKGAMRLITWMIGVVAACWAMIEWARNHIKL